MIPIRCAENILAGRRVHGLWHVHPNAEHQEAGTAGSQEGGAGGLRMVPCPPFLTSSPNDPVTRSHSGPTPTGKESR